MPDKWPRRKPVFEQPKKLSGRVLRILTDDLSRRTSLRLSGPNERPFISPRALLINNRTYLKCGISYRENASDLWARKVFLNYICTRDRQKTECRLELTTL